MLNSKAAEKESPQPTPRQGTMKGRSTLIVAVLCVIGFFAESIVARADEVLTFRMITHAIARRAFA
jgi:hypothetical protein